MVRNLLVRGMLAGLLAGLVYAVFANVVGEPPLDAAIAYEEHVAGGHDHGGAVAEEPAAGSSAPESSAAAEEAPLVSRGIQSTIGLGVASLVYGAALGGILSLAFAAVYGRVGALGVRATAVVTTLVGFVAVILVPFVKYPASPPASTDDSTIALRTGLFLLAIILSVAFAVGAVVLRERLVGRLGGWNATIAAAAAYVVVSAVVLGLLPTADETPADFPAEVLYDFRAASLGGHLVLWTVLALVFGVLADQALRRTSTPAAAEVG